MHINFRYPDHATGDLREFRAELSALPRVGEKVFIPVSGSARQVVKAVGYLLSDDGNNCVWVLLAPDPKVDDTWDSIID